MPGVYISLLALQFHHAQDMSLHQRHAFFDAGEGGQGAGFEGGGLFGAVTGGDEEQMICFVNDGREQDLVAAG